MFEKKKWENENFKNRSFILNLEKRVFSKKMVTKKVTRFFIGLFFITYFLFYQSFDE